MGLIGQETTGAGGFSYALRTIPVMWEYMRLVKEYARPGALVFNFTNPSGLVTQALYDAGYNNIIGICDNATGIKIDIARALQVNASDLTVKVYGLNHLSWAGKVELGGRDILPMLLGNESFLESFHSLPYFDPDLVRCLGEIPNGYLYYFYHRDRALKNLLAAKESRGEFILDIKSLGIGHLPENRTVTEIYEGYAGVVFNYIDSMNCDKGMDLAVSVPNRGAIPGMEAEDVVEVTCRVGRGGAVPMRFEEAEIKKSNLLLMQTVKRYEKLTVEAVTRKSRDAAVEALTVHPLVQDYSLAVKLVEAYCELNRPWIGEWK